MGKIFQDLEDEFSSFFTSTSKALSVKDRDPIIVLYYLVDWDIPASGFITAHHQDDSLEIAIHLADALDWHIINDIAIDSLGNYWTLSFSFENSELYILKYKDDFILDQFEVDGVDKIMNDYYGNIYTYVQTDSNFQIISFDGTQNQVKLELDNGIRDFYSDMTGSYVLQEGKLLKYDIELDSY